MKLAHTTQLDARQSITASRLLPLWTVHQVVHNKELFQLSSKPESKTSDSGTTDEIAQCNAAFESLLTREFWGKNDLITFMSIVYRRYLSAHPDDEKQRANYNQLNPWRDNQTATEINRTVSFFKDTFAPAIQEGRLDCDINQLGSCIDKILPLLLTPSIKEEEKVFDPHFMATNAFLLDINVWIEGQRNTRQHQRRRSLPENKHAHDNTTKAASHACRSSMPSLFNPSWHASREEKNTQPRESKHSGYHI